MIGGERRYVLAEARRIDADLFKPDEIEIGLLRRSRSAASIASGRKAQASMIPSRRLYRSVFRTALAKSWTF
jgi:hypothetical protein